MGKPKRIRRLLCGGLALGLAGALSGGALAAPPTGSTQTGKTAVGVQTADIAPSSLSYTVPLYLTVAAAGGLPGNSRVVTPDGYCLKNTTESTAGGTYPGIAVTEVKVCGVTGGKWSLRAQPTSGLEINLSIGGLTLPDVNAGITDSVEALITKSGNKFYDAGTGKFRLIPGGPQAEAWQLPVKGSLPEGFVPADVSAAAQFRIKYTVSLLDGAGQPIGIFYEGPSKEQVVSPSASSSGGN